MNVANMDVRPSVLVGIASHGTAQDHFLARVVSEYRKLDMPCRIVVLSNIDKHVEGAEVLVGVPTRDPYSLPFAHRRLFADNLDQYDLFIYAEDDTLLTQRTIHAFLDLQRELDDTDILGFMRSETRSDGTEYIVTVNHLFRWLPGSVVQRGPGLFAEFSNQHSGCFIATRKQMARAIASGGFLVPPRSAMYGMLETAASDIYTQCGFRRLISLSRIEDFIVPHLANKYYSQMGIPIDELRDQVNALMQLHTDKQGWTGSLLTPQTSAPGFRWSKLLYERAGTDVLDAIPASARRLLSVGATSGANEVCLAQRGVDVAAAPLDFVFGNMIRRRGIRTVEGSIARVAEQLADEEFDAILLADVLHLADDPVDWLRSLRSLLASGGEIVGAVPVIPNLLSVLRDVRSGRILPFVPQYATHGVHAVGVRRLLGWCRASGLDLVQITRECERPETIPVSRAGRMLKSRAPSRLIFRARAAS
jgi:SAM-dependent methyltransferase